MRYASFIGESLWDQWLSINARCGLTRSLLRSTTLSAVNDKEGFWTFY